MSQSGGGKQFPDLSNKLAAPKKGSIFERQKQEAEAKRLREEAETAAVYDDFVKSFEDDDPRSEGDSLSVSIDLSAGPKSGPGRYFKSASKKSGPGSLGPVPSTGAKRKLDGLNDPRRNGRVPLHSDDMRFHGSDEENEHLTSRAAERAIARPTIQMSSLPPGMSPAVIKSLLPENLAVEDIRVLRSTGNATDRKSDSAIITFAKDTAASSLDAAVSVLQDRYLERGYRLALSRHLSSATLHASGDAGTTVSSTPMPFGATVQLSGSSSLRHAAPLSLHSGRYAPPSSYLPSSRTNTHVLVRAPKSFSQVRLINKTIEQVLLRGPEFEALLMSRSRVRREERWAFLWNARSEEGVWYRWRLWETLSETQAKETKRRSDTAKNTYIFDGSAPWVEINEDRLVHEFVTGLDEVIQNDSYESSDEFESGDENGVPKTSHKYTNRGIHAAGPDLSNLSADDDSVPLYLSPTQRARLVHLLARLPANSARLRRGDVARVTGFAIAHAGAGAEEVADLLVGNTIRPLSVSERLKKYQLSGIEAREQSHANDNNGERSKDLENVSQSILVGLHILSDLLSSSSTSGIRHSWKYRQLIHSNLRGLSVFRHLGQVEHKISRNVGRIRAEKWHRSIMQGVLGLWETWAVFMGEEMAEFVKEYEAGVKEHSEDAEKADQAQVLPEKDKKESRWRAVDSNVDVNSEAAAHYEDWPKIITSNKAAQMTDFAENSMTDVPMGNEDDEDVEDIDGIPMEEDDWSDVGEKPIQTAEIVDISKSDSESAMNSDQARLIPSHSSNFDLEAANMSSRTINVKSRPRAVDMFNSSDEENAV